MTVDLEMLISIVYRWLALIQVFCASKHVTFPVLTLSLLLKKNLFVMLAWVLEL